MKRRLLYLSQTLPYPPDSGVKIRAYHTLRILSHAFDITALCFFRRRQTGSDGAAAAAESLSKYGVVEAFPIPQEWSRTRLIGDHARSLARGVPYVDEVFRSAEFEGRLLSHLGRTSFDVIHFESASLSRYVETAPDIARVCIHHNVESSLLGRRADVAGNRLIARYLKLQAARLRGLEARVCPLMDLNVAVTDADRAEFLTIAPGATFQTIPNGVDTGGFNPLDGPTEGVALLGGTDWFPNLDALEYFAEKILPKLRHGHPQVRVTCVGRASPDQIDHFRHNHGIELTGYVDDIRPFIHRARCVAVPLRVGGGSRLKILDSWAMGKAVVSTTIGCEGLQVIPGHNALIEDDPARFAAEISNLLDSEGKAADLGRAARRTVEDIYSWDAIEPQMLNAYNNLFN